MKKTLSITFMILFVAAMAFAPERGRASARQPICIVHPDVIQACEESGGRFDFGICSCVSSAQLPL